jgi:hypothetical protein
MSSKANRALRHALVEYLVLVLPVAFYVGLESYHRLDWLYFFQSPEWAIATIFLQFQGSRLFFKYCRQDGRRLSEARVVLLALAALSIVVISSMNALSSMHAETAGKIAVRIALFFVTSVEFLLLVAAAAYQSKHGI